MGDVIGPCSTLPGSGHHVPDGTTCDDHPDRPAVARVQGETDSFGAELHDLCEECLRQYRAECAEDLSGCCDWCKQEATDLRHTRDYEEGMSGPVYRVCGACLKRQQDEIQEELDRYDDMHGDDWGEE